MNNREIKFRVWDESRRVYLHTFGYFAHESDTGGYQLVFQLSDYAWKGPYICEQFTGLTLSNGTEIYEGDILNTKTARWEVVFEKGAFMAKWLMGTPFIGLGKYHALWPLIDHAIPLGNRFENPDLLIS